MTDKKHVFKEIRLRDVSPELSKQFESVMLELREATVSKALEKLIVRFFEFKKRIEEQNKEIAQLSNDLRTAQFRLSTAKAELTEFESYLTRFLKYTDATAKKIKASAQTFGTKKPKAGQARTTRKAKIVPKKKATVKTKKKK